MMAAVSDALIVLGLVVMTIGIYGMYRMPDVYARLHAASKVAFLGTGSIAIAAMLVADTPSIMRLALILLLLLFTTPMSSHAIGRAAYVHHERMSSPGAIDESGHHLAEHEEPSWRL